jgi:hypothetical protein
MLTQTPVNDNSQYNYSEPINDAIYRQDLSVVKPGPEFKN